MLADSMLPYSSLPWAHEEPPSNNGNADYSEVFDEREFQDFFSTDSLAHFGQSSMTQLLKNNNAMEAMFHQPGPLNPVPMQQAAIAPPRPLVNLQMIVDPVTNKVTYPKQILTYDVGGKIEKVVFGPVTLDAIPQDPKPVDMNPLLTPAAAFTPFSEFQQQQHMTHEQPLFMPISPCPTPNDSIGSSNSTSVSTPTADTETPPLRALSAYNFFFRDERERILHGGECEWTSDKQKQLLAAHWQQDRTKKRRHRKTHGKINFTTLSKLVSQRWKELDESKKQFYREVASLDFERYQREMDDYKRRIGQPMSFQHVVG